MTYPPSMLPIADEDDEAEVVVVVPSGAADILSEFETIEDSGLTWNGIKIYQD